MNNMNINSFDFVLFGANGDLAKRKIIPSIYSMFFDGEITNSFSFIGISRSALTKEEFINIVDISLKKYYSKNKLDEVKINEFKKCIDYISFDIQKNEDLNILKTKLKNKNNIFYLAIMPSLFNNVFKALSFSNIINKNSKNYS